MPATPTVKGAFRVDPAEQQEAADAMAEALYDHAPHVFQRLARNRVDDDGYPTLAGVLNVLFPGTGWAGGGCGDEIDPTGRVKVYCGDLADELTPDALSEVLTAATPYVHVGGCLTAQEAAPDGWCFQWRVTTTGPLTSTSKRSPGRPSRV